MKFKCQFATCSGRRKQTFEMKAENRDNLAFHFLGFITDVSQPREPNRLQNESDLNNDGEIGWYACVIYYSQSQPKS